MNRDESDNTSSESLRPSKQAAKKEATIFLHRRRIENEIVQIFRFFIIVSRRGIESRKTVSQCGGNGSVLESL